MSATFQVRNGVGNRSWMATISDRDLSIVEARTGGQTLRSLAIEHGVSVERIRQIIARVERLNRRRV